MLVFAIVAGRAAQTLDIDQLPLGVEVAEFGFLDDGSGAGPDVDGVLREVVDVVLEELVVPIFVEISLRQALLAFVDLVVGLATGATSAAFEDGGSFFAELEVDDVGAAGRGEYLFVESDDFEFGAARDELGLYFFGAFAGAGLLDQPHVHRDAAQFGLGLRGLHFE